MNYAGSCRCRSWALRIATVESPGSLRPRACDCDYCQSHPSAIVSEPTMFIELISDGGKLAIDTNGDRLANFYRCNSCGDLLAVGCEIDGELRGAANALLLDQKDLLGEAVTIQPRLLSGAEKLSRWKTLWGRLKLHTELIQSR
jgi:hypothetical protein